MTSDEKKPAFDSSAASSLVKDLRGAFGTGKTRSYEWRASQLRSLLKLLDERESDIVEALRSDLSKPGLEAYVTEVVMLKSSCEFTLKGLKRWMMPEKAKTTITTFPSSAEIVPEPLGVVLVISAWNYPFMLSVDPVIGAIAAGNAVVLKPSEIAPASSSLLAKLFGEYLDSSAVKVVEGAVHETTALLEQKWDKIFYTAEINIYTWNASTAQGIDLGWCDARHLVLGNGKVGRIVSAAAAKHLTPIALELGGKCPAIVDSDINLTVTARRIIGGKWALNNGQACIAADHIITTKDFAPKLIDTLKLELEKFFGKDPLISEDLSRIVNSNHFARLTKLLDEDKVSGKVVHGGRRNEDSLKIAPTILLDVPEDSLIMNEEIFGPLLPIVTVDNIEESFSIINSGDKPLAAYLFTNNKTLKGKFVRNVSAGGLLINDISLHFANPHLPFGGVGESGIGACHGKFSFDTFSHKKAVLYRSFAGDAPARYPPYTPAKLKLLKALLGGDIIGIIRALIGW